MVLTLDDVRTGGVAVPDPVTPPVGFDAAAVWTPPTWEVVVHPHSARV
jgi:hypothetical protein